MTRLELFKGLCDLTDALERAADGIEDDWWAGELNRLRERCDTLVDACVRQGLEPLHATDTSACPACGQPTCTHWQPNNKPAHEDTP